jgi:hypothetical protein
MNQILNCLYYAFGNPVNICHIDFLAIFVFRPIIYFPNLKDANGFVACPILFKLKCPKCQATGRLAHTLKFCPVNNRDQTSNKVISFLSEPRPQVVNDQYPPKSDQPSSWSGDHRSSLISRQQNSLNVPGLTWNASEPVTPIQPLNRPVSYACHRNLVTLQGPNISTPVTAMEEKFHEQSPPSVKPSDPQDVYGSPHPSQIHQQNLVKLERANTWDTSLPGTMKEMNLDQYSPVLQSSNLQGAQGRLPPPQLRHQDSDKLQVTSQSIKTDKIDLQAFNKVHNRFQVLISLTFHIQLFVPKCFRSLKCLSL